MMNGIRSHLYTVLLSFAGIAFLFGAYVVSQRAAVPSAIQTDAWGSGVIPDAQLIPDVPATDKDYSHIVQKDYVLDSPVGKNTSAAADSVQPKDAFDWDALEKALTKPTSPTGTHTDSASMEAYSFIPADLVTIPQPPENESLEDRALRNYGNSIGAAIQAYESEHANQAAVLTDHSQDRTNARKQESLRQLGRDLRTVGESISALGAPPAAFERAGEKLAVAYRDIGEKLARIPDTRTDDDFVKTIMVYNAAAEKFVEAYVGLALLFQAHGISFTKDESGSVFMMPASN